MNKYDNLKIIMYDFDEDEFEIEWFKIRYNFADWWNEIGGK